MLVTPATSRGARTVTAPLCLHFFSFLFCYFRKDILLFIINSHFRLNPSLTQRQWSADSIIDDADATDAAPPCTPKQTILGALITAVVLRFTQWWGKRKGEGVLPISEQFQSSFRERSSGSDWSDIASGMRREQCIYRAVQTTDITHGWCDSLFIPGSFRAVSERFHNCY